MEFYFIKKLKYKPPIPIATYSHMHVWLHKRIEFVTVMYVPHSVYVDVCIT